MALVEMVMPKMGESIMEATIISWLKKEGDVIEAEESLLEVATDKVDTEVPSTHAGIVKEILAQEGDTIEVGKPIVVIDTEQDADQGYGSGSKKASTNGQEVKKAAPEGEAEKEAVLEEVAEPQKSKSSRFYSPLVLNIAKQESISMDELDTIPGTGKEGRVTKKDMLAYVKERSLPAEANGQGKPASRPTPEVPKVEVPRSASDEIIEMDRMRKMIAERMVQSKQTSPHVTSFVEADVTGVVRWRDKVKDQFLQREGEKLTYTPIFIEAVVQTIKDFPMINISVDGDKIIKRAEINIGMAVALPSGNLIVPVIRNADKFSLAGLTTKVNDLAKRARENKLKAEELAGGTFTLTNVGTFGNVMGTPIIMQPQVAILATGAIQKKPAVIETAEGDMIGIRHKMFLSHSYDHRVVDGSLGGMFVRKVADYLENWDADRKV